MFANDPGGYGLQHPIAYRGTWVPFFLRLEKLVVQSVEKAGAVWQAGQQIVLRHMGDLLGSFALLRYIGGHLGEAEEQTIILVQRGNQTRAQKRVPSLRYRQPSVSQRLIERAVCSARCGLLLRCSLLGQNIAKLRPTISSAEYPFARSAPHPSS